jgi:hypothetical protein
MLAVIDYSREDSRPAVYGILDPEYAFCCEPGYTGADLYWDREFWQISDELAQIEADNYWWGEFPQETYPAPDFDWSMD